MKGYRPNYLRQKNYISILNLFKNRQTLSVSEILQNVELSKTTVNLIISALVEHGILSPAGKGASTQGGGKRPMLFTLNGAHSYCLAVMCSPWGLVFRVFDLQLQAVYERYVPWEARDYRETIAQIAQISRSILEKLSIAPESLYGVALHTGGIVDSEQGVLLRPMVPTWPCNVSIRRDFIAALGFSAPVYIENSARFSGNFELLNPDNQQLGTVIVVNFGFSGKNRLEIGIGGCLLKNGQMSRSSEDFLSEIGHMIVDIRSEASCLYGHHGCLETVITAQSITAQAKALLPQYPGSVLAPVLEQRQIGLLDVLEYAKDGDPLADSLAEYLAGAFASLLHNLVLCHAPDRIIIQSSDTDNTVLLLFQRISRELYTHTLFGLEKRLDLRYSQGSFEALANLGAASFCRERFIGSLTSHLATAADSEEGS